MNELKFNSQICTTKEQSQRLLDLGLKPETADMVLLKELAYDEVAHCIYDADTYMIRPIDYLVGEKHRGHIPAWSLHRLIEMLPTVITQDYYSLILGINATCIYYADNEYAETFKAIECNLYDCVVKCIEWLIKEDYFNKEYLKQ